MEEAAADELLGFLKLQREATGSALPHRHHLLIEHVEEPGGRGDFKQMIFAVDKRQQFCRKMRSVLLITLTVGLDTARRDRLRE